MLDYTKDNFPVINSGDRNDRCCLWSVCPDVWHSVSAMLTTAPSFSQFPKGDNSNFMAVETEVNMK